MAVCLQALHLLWSNNDVPITTVNVRKMKTTAEHGRSYDLHQFALDMDKSIHQRIRSPY